MAKGGASSKEQKGGEAATDTESAKNSGSSLYFIFFIIACATAFLYMQYDIPSIQAAHEVTETDAADYKLHPKYARPISSRNATNSVL
jgi:hypothetical protein